MLPSKPNGLKWAGVSLILLPSKGHMPSEKTAQALFAWFLNNAERQERFAAGSKSILVRGRHVSRAGSVWDEVGANL